MLLLLVGFIPLTASIFVHEGGSCGTNSIPYKLIVDDEGKPEIFCDIPPCFKRSSRKGVSAYNVACDPYSEVVCSGDTQWTGGLLELNNGTHRTLKTECCSYQDMELAQVVKSVFINIGDNFTGGKVFKRGFLQGFDVIKEIRKTITSENQVQYILGIYRLPCVDEEDTDYNDQVLSRNKRRLRGKAEEEKTNEDESEELVEDKELETLRSLRRLPASRRRALLQRLEDYYDYDYEIAPRRPNRRQRPSARKLNDRLWPVSYPKARAHAEPIYEDKDQTMISLNSSPEITFGDEAAASYDGTYTSNYPAPAPPVAQQAAPTEAAYNYQGYAISYPASSYQGVSYPGYQNAPAYQSYQPYSQTGYNYGTGSGGQPNLNNIFSRMQCFSGDMTVETELGPKQIKDLRIGDRVLSIDESMINFAPIVMFLHRKEHELTDFLLIEMDSEVSLKITDNHLIYKTSCEPNEELRLVPAKEVNVGDCLHIATDSHQLARQRVTKISQVEETGYYAPVTSTGDIFVNGVLSSCHSNVALKALQQTFFSVYKTLSGYMNKLSWYPNWEETGDLPLGLTSITSVIDVFIPSSLL